MVYNTLRAATIDISAASVNTAGDLVVTHGTGFFIDKTHVATAAHLLLTTSDRSPASSYYLSRVQRIIGSFHGSLFDLKLIGLSPINDVAVLEAVGAPSNHGVLEWGNSSQATVGETVYTLGNLLSMDVKALSAGVLRNNKMTYSSNAMVSEVLDVNIATGGGNSGAPFVDSSGKVIGIVSFTLNWQQANPVGIQYLLNTGTTCGPTQTVAQKIIEDILAGKNTITVEDPLGNWLHWTQSALAAVYQYNTPISLLIDTYGATVDGLNKPIVDPDVKGAVITSIEENNPLGLYLSPGDMIVSINGNPIGYQAENQVSIGQALLSVPVGTEVVVGAKLKDTGYKVTGYIPAVTKQLSQTSDHIRQNVQVLNTGFTTTLAEDLAKLTVAIVSLGIALAKLISAATSPPPIDIVALLVALVGLIPKIVSVVSDVYKISVLVHNYINSQIENAEKQVYSKTGNRTIIANTGVFSDSVIDIASAKVVAGSYFTTYYNYGFYLNPGTYNYELIATPERIAGSYANLRYYHGSFFAQTTSHSYPSGNYQFSGYHTNAVHPAQGSFYVNPPGGPEPNANTILSLWLTADFQGLLGRGIHVYVLSISPGSESAL
jgi:S1-C subfamily serine protease